MKLIVHLRHYILGLFLALTVAGLFFIPQVTINYDGSSYLPEESNTKKALVVMDEEFGVYGACEVMVENISLMEAVELASELSALNGIQQVTFIPTQETYFHDEKALYQITFDSGNYDEETKTTLKALKDKLTTHDVYFRGESIDSIAYSSVIESEILKIILILVPIVLIILFMATSSWIEPLLFIIVVLISVVINMGTNAFFPSISYMTHATCGILQLALCMDYTVMMIHAYKKEKESGLSAKEAVRKAGRASFIPILSSMLTTVAGFVAILFMKYKIGMDIGLVLIKGTLISFAATFLLMPGLIVIFDKLIERTAHKSIFRPMKATFNFIFKTRYVMPVLALALIGFAFAVQQENEFVFSEHKIVSESPTLSASYDKIETAFGLNNTLVILTPHDIGKEGAFLEGLTPILKDIEVKSLISPLLFHQLNTKEELSGFLAANGLDPMAIAGIGQIFDMMQGATLRASFSIVEMVDFIKETPYIPEEQKVAFTPFISEMEAARSALEGPNYDRIILVTDFEAENDEVFAFLDLVDEVAREHLDSYYLLGESVGVRDVKTIIEKDYWKVTIITIVLIFIILLLSFKNLAIPVILLIVILGATWINMAAPVILGENLLYIGYVIVSCIMLGATIDYAILYTHQYRTHRLTVCKKEAMALAFTEAKHTVLTSGFILVGAGFTLGFVSTIPSISVFGSLIGRGALSAIILVLFVLPQTLLIFDCWITGKNRFMPKEVINIADLK